MERILERFATVLDQYRCNATLPIPASALARSNGVIQKYQERGVEFAVHGFYHIDHSRLPLNEQLVFFRKARHVFEKKGVACHGFRSPYLRWSEATIAALIDSGFLYEGSQALAWDVIDGIENGSYRRVLDFYGAISAVNYPALPRLENGLVRIPYSLPDDEALVDRFHLKAGETMNRLWLSILDRTYTMGELFVLGLHPERIDLCEMPLVETLHRARTLSPRIWIARLDEIARWWIDRTQAAENVVLAYGDEISVRVKGPAGVTLLTRGVTTKPLGIEWDGRFRWIQGKELIFQSDRRPFIGVSPASSLDLIRFLHQQGFIVEVAENKHAYTFFLDRPDFCREDERPLLAQIEQGDFPLIRLGRWPNGARSALCITGDIDALTIWDYWLRFLGH